jgi:mRNA interferase YafQ
MRRIDRTRNFKRDYRRIKATPRYRNIDTLLAGIVGLLANDQPLPAANRDHVLTGNWIGLRECHVRPDLLLVYDKPGPDVLILTRLGSHSELFG